MNPSMRKLLAAVAAIAASFVLAVSAAADTPRYPLSTDQYSYPYHNWILYSSPYVPQPHDLWPGVHHHVVGSPCGGGVWGCTDGHGEIWINNYVASGQAPGGSWQWLETFLHEVGHNVQAQEMQAGHYQHFADLVGQANFNQEAWADTYSYCGMAWPTGPQGWGISDSEYHAVCGWLDRATWGIRY